MYQAAGGPSVKQLQWLLCKVEHFVLFFFYGEVHRAVPDSGPACFVFGITRGRRRRGWGGVRGGDDGAKMLKTMYSNEVREEMR